MSLETITIVFGCLIVYCLFRIEKKIENLFDSFESWYGDWQKKYDPYIPDNYE
jgi:hypothetical protein